jgi:hypothetical protein
MELSGRPLLDNPLDARLFVPRPEAERLRQNAEARINTLVLGEPGSGKTSLLRQVLLGLRERDQQAFWVDGGRAETVVDLLALIEDDLTRALGSLVGGPPLPSGPNEGVVASAAIRRLQLRLERRERGVIFLDLAAGGVDPHALFGRFRDALWQLPLTWIVAVPNTMRVALTTPPADAFFEDVFELEDLTSAQQQDLIKRRLDPDDVTPWRLPDVGEGNPRRLLQVVRESFRTGEPVDVHLVARAMRAGELAVRGRPAKLVYEYLEDHGPTSASDEEFLEYLGWSRQRAAKVLSDLETAGLVRGETRASEAGRPRRVFAVVPPPP